jgi:hypothetical protein
MIDFHNTDRVLRQFGEQQDVSDSYAYFARRSRDAAVWGPVVSFDAAQTEFLGLLPVAWTWRSATVDPGWC